MHLTKSLNLPFINANEIAQTALHVSFIALPSAASKYAITNADKPAELMPYQSPHTPFVIPIVRNAVYNP